MGGKDDCNGRPEAAKSDILYIFGQENVCYLGENEVKSNQINFVLLRVTHNSL